MIEKDPPDSGLPRLKRAGGGGGTYQAAHGKPGEIRRRKVTGLGRQSDSPSGVVMFAGLQRAKQGKSCGAKVWGLNRKRHGSPPAGYLCIRNNCKEREKFMKTASLFAKRGLAVLLALVLCVGMLSMNAFACNTGTSTDSSIDETFSVKGGGNKSWYQLITYHANYPDGTCKTYTVKYEFSNCQETCFVDHRIGGSDVVWLFVYASRFCGGVFRCKPECLLC